jgi:hypothetical protein
MVRGSIWDGQAAAAGAMSKQDRLQKPQSNYHTKMRRKRNSWDVMRRQSKVSQLENPAFTIDPRYLSYGIDDRTAQLSVAESYAKLEQQLTEFLGIDSAELSKRFTASFGISPLTLEKIIAGDFDKVAAETNPWVWFLKETKMFGCDKVLRGLLSEVEFRTFQRAEWVKKNRQNLNIEWSRLGELSEAEFHVFQERETNPHHWSPYGRLDLPKLDLLKMK